MSTRPDKKALRQRLMAQRQSLPGRAARSAALHAALRAWLAKRPETCIGAYWPIKGEFDPLPALCHWQQEGQQQEGQQTNQRRRIGLPVMDKASKTLAFHDWRPGCPMEMDAWGIPQPKGTPAIAPDLLLVPCVGYAPGGVRLGYGGGFYDRTLAALRPRPYAVGLAFACAFVADLLPEPHDAPLDAILTDCGLAWPAEAGSH